MNKIDKEQLLSEEFIRPYDFNMGELRRFVKENPQIEDRAPVMIQRVEDMYFTGFDFKGEQTTGWSVYLIEGDTSRMVKNFNKNKRGTIAEIPMDDELMDQFYSPHCITKENDNSIVLIYSHY